MRGGGGWVRVLGRIPLAAALAGALGQGVPAVLIVAVTGALAPLLLACRAPEVAPPPGPRRATRPATRRGPSRAQILAGSELPAPQPDPLPEDPRQVTVHRLSNGLTVVLSPDPTLDAIHTATVVRAGRRHEPPGASGAAAMLPYLLAAGSDDLGTLDFEAERPSLDAIAALYAELRQTEGSARRAEIHADIHRRSPSLHALPEELGRLRVAVGISGYEARVEDDHSAYFATVPPGRFEAWAAIEAERLIDGVFRDAPGAVETLAADVLLDRAPQATREDRALRRALFPDHPYGRIGLELAALEAPPLLEAADFYRRWYVPNNVALFVTGDIDDDRVLSTLEASFGRWRARRLPPIPGGALGELPPNAPALVQGDRNAGVTLAWRAAAPHDEQASALPLLDALFDALVLDDGARALPPRIAHRLERLIEASVWTVRADTPPGLTADAHLAVLLEAIEGLRRGAFSDAALDAARLRIRRDRALALERPRTRLEPLIAAYLLRRPWSSALRDGQALETLRREALAATARSELDDRFVTLLREPGAAAMSADPHGAAVDLLRSRPPRHAEARHGDFAATMLEQIDRLDPLPQPRWFHPGRYVVGTRPLRVAVDNPHGELYELRLDLPLGTRSDPLACVAIEWLGCSGIRGDPVIGTGNDLRRALAALDAELELRCGADGSSLILRGQGEGWEATVALVDRWLRDPALDPGVLDALVGSIHERRRAQRADPEILERALADHLAFGDDSPWLAGPDPRALRRATARRVAATLARWRRLRPEIVSFGPGTEARARIEALDLSAFGARRPPPGPRRPRLRRLDTPLSIELVHRPGPTALVELVVPLGDGPPGDRGAAELAAAYLGGYPGAPLGRSLRGSNAPILDASVTLEVGEHPDDPGALRLRVVTLPDTLAEVVEALVALPATAREAGIEPSSLALARAAIATHLRGDPILPRELGPEIAAWARAGHEEDPRRDAWIAASRVDAVALDQILRDWSSRPGIVGVAVESGRADLDALGALGPVRELGPDQLLGPAPPDPPSPP